MVHGSVRIGSTDTLLCGSAVAKMSAACEVQGYSLAQWAVSISRAAAAQVFVGRVMTQIGGDIHVHAQAGHGVEEAVARPGADGDCLHHLVGVAGGTNAHSVTGRALATCCTKSANRMGCGRSPMRPSP